MPEYLTVAQVAERVKYMRKRFVSGCGRGCSPVGMSANSGGYRKLI